MSNVTDLAKINKAEKELAQLEVQYSAIAAEASLAGASMLPPPAGTAADLASLVVSLSKGSWGDALIDLVGIIPLGGDAVKAAIKGPKIVAQKNKIQAAIDAARVKLTQEKLALKTDRKDLKNKTAEACNKPGTEPCPKMGGGESGNPVFKISKKKYPNHAKVINNAEKKGHSTQNLERGSGTKAAQRNRRRAQAEIRKTSGPPPKGYDYDEFPYASSNQGGKGAHVEPVKSTENQAAGRDLGQFYREHGIKEGDKYDVKVTD